MPRAVRIGTPCQQPYAAGMNSQRLLLACKFAFLCIHSSPVDARSILAPTLAQSTKHADYVYEVQVTRVTELQGDDHACGSVYEATVLRVKKGQALASKQLAFGYVGGLRVGARYRLFLKEDPQGLGMLRRIEEQGVSQEEQEHFKRACLPQYQMDRTYFRADRIGSSQ